MNRFTSPLETLCVICGALAETCLHLLHVKTGIHVPHPEGLGQSAIMYWQARR